jgi:hypothetical protein
MFIRRKPPSLPAVLTHLDFLSPSSSCARGVTATRLHTITTAFQYDLPWNTSARSALVRRPQRVWTQTCRVDSQTRVGILEEINGSCRRGSRRDYIQAAQLSSAKMIRIRPFSTAKVGAILTSSTIACAFETFLTHVTGRLRVIYLIFYCLDTPYGGNLFARSHRCKRRCSYPPSHLRCVFYKCFAVSRPSRVQHPTTTTTTSAPAAF